MNENLVTDNLGNIRLYNGDCMEWMKSVPDNYYELAIADPPFGINITKSGRLKRYNTDNTTWDNDKEYKYWIGIKECYSKELYIEHSSYFKFSFTYFKSEELAKQAIEILGEETIKTALSTDW